MEFLKRNNSKLKKGFQKIIVKISFFEEEGKPD